MRGGFAIVALGVLARCSLGVGDFEIPSCTQQSDCEVLNAGLGPCSRYVCVRATRKCTRSLDSDGDGDPRTGCGGGDCDDSDARRNSRGAETCDGLDNNCNEIIDEGRITVSGVAPLVPSTELGGSSAQRLSALGTPARGALAWTTESSSRVAAFEAGSTRFLGAPNFFREQSADLLQPLGIVPGCGSAGACNAAEFALDDAEGSDWFGAAVNTAGCAAGNLRVGYLRTTGAQAGGFVDLGPAARSASTGGLGCGGTAPSLARLRERGSSPRALLAWIARDRAAGVCEPAPLRVLGLHLEGMAGAIPWVNSSNAGMPQPLGMAASATPVAIASHHRAAEDLGFGWFLAWGEANGSVRLRYVPRFDDAPAFSASLRAETPRMSAALDLSGEAFAVMSAGTPGNVTIAVGDTRPEGVEIGLGWIDACERGRVWFARARYNPAMRVFSAESPIALSTEAGSRPVLRWVGDGFLTSSYTRGAEAAGSRRGGWLVAWSEEGRIMARRVAAFSGAPIDEAPLRLREGAGLGAMALGAGAGPRSLRGYWFNAASQSIEAGQVLCEAP